MSKKVKFSIDVEINEKWAPELIALLRSFQLLGDIGSSRVVGFFADGDGSFHPKFKFHGINNIETAIQTKLETMPKCEIYYDNSQRLMP